MNAKTALKKAIKAAGSPRLLGERLGISKQAVLKWDEVPPLRVIPVEKITGVSRYELRPDLYPPEKIKEKV